MSEQERIGIYQVIKVLGGGGMGVVYLVEDTESGGLYALKLLSPSLSPSEVEIRRFRREFMTMSRLRHPNIVEVYESGIHNDALYFVMEYVQGTMLRERFMSKEYPEDELALGPFLEEINDPKRVKLILRLTQQICEALAWVHNLGIVHRDLKPENLIATDDGRIKLLDFGIAKRLGGPEISQAHSIMGTFSYISPEQAQCVDVDGRSDLYSLGVILYEMLAGRAPFIAPEPIGRLYMHLNTPAPPLSQWNPYIDPDLEAIVMRLLEKDPLARFQSAEELHVALQPFVNDSPTVSLGFWEERGFGNKAMTDPKFVGRQKELQILQSYLDPRLSSNVKLALVSGNIGSGKTRLGREFLSSMRVQQVECCSVRCLSESPPYSAYQELMEQLRVGLNMRFGEIVSSWWGDSCNKWFQLMSLTPNDDPDSDILDTITTNTGQAEEEKIALFDGARCILERVLQEVPVVFFFDDIMNLDEMSLELTEFLAKELSRLSLPHRFLMVGAFRNEDVGTEHPLNQVMLHLTPERLYVLLDLQPLSKMEVRELATSMLAIPPSDEALDILMEQSQGIPYFVEELLKAWFEEGNLLESEDGWYLLEEEMESDDTEHFKSVLPLAIRKRLARRLELLSPNARKIAEWIAVLAKEASYDLLLRVTQLSEDELLTHLDELLQHKIVFEDWSTGVENYSFTHAGLQEALYLQLDEETIRQYHLGIAQALKRTAGRDGSFELLAHHFLAAGEEEQGAWYMLLAAEQQLRAFAHRSCWELLERCAPFVAPNNGNHFFLPGSSWWIRYYQTRLELLEALGRYPEGLQVAQEAISQLYDSSMEISLWRWQAVFLRHTGRYQEAMQCIIKALNWDRQGNERLYLLQEQGRIFRALGRYNEALEAYQEALSIAISKKKLNEQGRISGMIGNIFHQRGEFAEARTHYLKFVEISSRQEDRRGQLDALCKLGTLEFDEGEIESSLLHFEQVIASAQEIGDRRSECTALSLFGKVQADRRLYDEAQEKIQAALDIARELSERRIEGELLGFMGIISYQLGHFFEARQFFEQGLETSMAIGNLVAEIWIRGFLALTLFRLKEMNQQEALEEMQRVLHMSEQMEATDVILQCKLLLAHLYRLFDQRELALDHLVAARYLAVDVGNRRLLAKIEAERYQLDKHLGLVWGASSTKTRTKPPKFIT